MKLLCLLVLVALCSEVLCNCGCIKCNPHLRVCQPAGSPIKVIYRDDDFCECPKKVPYTLQIPAEIPDVSPLRYFRYNVEQPKVIVRNSESSLVIPKSLDLQVQIPVEPVEPIIQYTKKSVPFLYGGLEAKTDRVVLQHSSPCNLPKEIPPLQEYVDSIPCDCRNNCNCRLNGCNFRYINARYVPKLTPAAHVLDLFKRKTFKNQFENLSDFQKEPIKDLLSILANPDYLDIPKRTVSEHKRNILDGIFYDELQPLMVYKPSLLGKSPNINHAIKRPSAIKLHEKNAKKSIDNLTHSLKTVQMNVTAIAHDEVSQKTQFWSTTYNISFQKVKQATPNKITPNRRNKRDINWKMLARKSNKRMAPNVGEGGSVRSNVLGQNKPKPKLQNVWQKLRKRNFPTVGQNDNRFRKFRKAREQPSKQTDSKTPFWRVEDFAPPDLSESYSKPVGPSRRWENSLSKGASGFWQKDYSEPSPRRFERWWQGDSSRNRHKRSIQVEDETMLPFYEIENQNVDFEPRISRNPFKTEPEAAHTPLLNLLGAPLRYFNQFNQVTKDAAPGGNSIPRMLGNSRRFFVDLFRTLGKDALSLGSQLVTPKRSRLPKRRFRRSTPEETINELVKNLTQLCKTRGNGVAGLRKKRQVDQSLYRVLDYPTNDFDEQFIAEELPQEEAEKIINKIPDRIFYEKTGIPNRNMINVINGYQLRSAKTSPTKLNQVVATIRDSSEYQVLNEEEPEVEDETEILGAEVQGNNDKNIFFDYDSYRRKREVNKEDNSNAQLDRSRNPSMVDAHAGQTTIINKDNDKTQVRTSNSERNDVQEEQTTASNRYYNNNAQLECIKSISVNDAQVEQTTVPNEIAKFLEDEDSVQTFLYFEGDENNEDFLNERPEVSEANNRTKRDTVLLKTNNKLNNTVLVGKTISEEVGSLFGMFFNFEIFNSNATKAKDLDNATFAVSATESKRSADIKLDEEEIAHMLEETKQMFFEWEDKAKNVQLQCVKEAVEQTDLAIKNLEKYDFSNDLPIYDNLAKLQSFKDELVKNISDERGSLLLKLKEVQILKEKTMRQIIKKLQDDNTNLKISLWVKKLIQLQKLHCAINKILHKLSFGKIDPKLLEVLQNVRLKVVNYTKQNNDQIDKLNNVARALKTILVQADPDTIRHEAAILWEMKNIRKLQSETIEELNKKVVQGVHKQKELKILFDLHKQFVDVEEKQKKLIKAISL